MGVMMHVLFVFFYLIIFDVSCYTDASAYATAACLVGLLHLHFVDGDYPGQVACFDSSVE